MSLNISLSDSVLETKPLQNVNFNGFLNCDGLTFLIALVLYSQSDYFNISNKDSDWLIVACCMRV